MSENDPGMANREQRRMFAGDDPKATDSDAELLARARALLPPIARTPALKALEELADRKAAREYQKKAEALEAERDELRRTASVFIGEHKRLSHGPKWDAGECWYCKEFAKLVR
jgi:hypothetical protein